MPIYQHILFATDLSLKSPALIDKAMSLAKLYQARTSLLHVLEKHPEYFYRFLELVDVEGKVTEEAEKQLKMIGHDYHIPSDDLHVSLGAPKIEIMAKAKMLEVDLIILGNHGRHGKSKLLGATANSVLHHAMCDVLIINCG